MPPLGAPEIALIAGVIIVGLAILTAFVWGLVRLLNRKK